MTFFANNRLIIEDRLQKLLENEPSSHEKLFDAARYSTLSEAKRLRPLITLALAVHYQVPIEQALDPACALELFHTYTLIHDDLPSMDDETERRGKPPLHHAYPEGLALLTGDYLLTHAFDTLANAPHITSDVKLQLIQSLAKRAGGNGVIAGQVVDLYTPDLTLDQLLYMYEKKTADLFCAAFEFGAILAQVDPAPLQSFGLKFGLAFQYIDDLEDIEKDEGKTTLLTLLGNEADSFIQKALNELKTEAELLEIPPIIDLVDHLLLRKLDRQELAAKTL